MMLEILIVFLITLVYSKDANLTVFHVKDWNKNETIKGKQGLICYELHKDIKANDKFYLHMYCDEDNKAINKLSYYNLDDVSCNNWQNHTIDIDNLSKAFRNQFGEPTSTTKTPKFRYEYEIKKSTDQQKFLLFIFQNFTGDKFTIGFDPVSGIGVLATVLISVGSLILLVIIILIIICCVCKKKCKKPKTTDSNFQSSYAEDPLVPEENIIQ